MRISKWMRLMAALLALLLLCGCGAEAPAPTAEPTEEPVSAPDEPTAAPTETPAPAQREEEVVPVSDVDGLLAAIGPNVTLALAAGTYDLAAAASYGGDTGNPYCRWEACGGDGYELVIENVNSLTLRGAGAGETILTAEERYASVLRFSACRNVTVSALTAGHTEAPGFCAGGVLRLDDCSLAAVEDCGLFGCGTIGVWAMRCSELTVTDTRIYECSDIAVYADNCRNVQVLNCEIDHNGLKIEGSAATCLFESFQGEDFTVAGCLVHDNTAQMLLRCNQTRNACFFSNQMEYNKLSNVMALFGYPATVDGCSFTGDQVQGAWYVDYFDMQSLMARDLEGRLLQEADFADMTYREIQREGNSAELRPPVDVPAGGEITVTTVDEFLDAIGPDRTIVLDGKSFNLADAADYGGVGGQYYYWEDCYDGPQLVITSLRGLTIRAAAEDSAAVTLTAVPRYANVILFRGCSDVTVCGFTMGHTPAPGYCTGGVLAFVSCSGIDLASCRLYGCGTLGVDAWDCSEMSVSDCEIYDCSYGGVQMSSVRGARFEGCRIHDVPSPALNFYGCSGLVWNGEAIADGFYEVDRNGGLLPFSFDGDPNGENADAPDRVALYYLGAELTELTVKEGDSVILQAQAVFPVVKQGKLNYSWSCDNAAALGLTVCRDNDRCIVKGLAAGEDTVLLTVTCNGVTVTIPVTVAAR